MTEIITRTLTGAVLVAVVIFASTYSITTSCTLWGALAFLGVKEVYLNKMGGFIGASLVVLAAVSTVALGYHNVESYNGLNIVAFLTIIWANDTFAYLGGMVMGRKFISIGLAPSISPKKSWEGALIGVLAALIVGWLWAGGKGALVGAIVGGLATCGDLVQSSAKRSAGVKDSGTLFPGHGGVLDRFDGLVIAAPITFLIILIISR